MAQEVDALVALHGADMQPLLEAAGAVRDAGHRFITFSPKVQTPALAKLQSAAWLPLLLIDVLLMHSAESAPPTAMETLGS